MSIDLFEHNKTAYESAAAMLAETSKAAVIHPTGTGKSFIGFKFCEDNPDKTVCWISPSDYIFRTQLENLKKTGAKIPENIKFFTYAKLTYMSDDELRLVCYGSRKRREFGKRALITLFSTRTNSETLSLRLLTDRKISICLDVGFPYRKKDMPMGN